MPFRLGLSTYSYTWSMGVTGYEPAERMTVFDLLGQARRLSVPVVQIADNRPLSDLDDAGLRRFRDQARDLAIDVEVGTRGIAEPELRRQLVIAAEVASPLLRVVIDGPGERLSLTQAIDRLAPQKGRFSDAGIMLAVENHDHFTAAELVTLVEELGTDWVGVCLDTVNSFGALEGPEQVIATLAPYVVNVHVKDFTILRASHAMGFTIQGAPAGGGCLDIPGLLAALPANRHITAVLELWTPPESDIASTVATEHKWVEWSVRYLAPVVAAA